MRIELPELMALFRNYCYSGSGPFIGALSVDCYSWWMYKLPGTVELALPVFQLALESNHPHAIELYRALIAARLKS